MGGNEIVQQNRDAQRTFFSHTKVSFETEEARDDDLESYKEDWSQRVLHEYGDDFRNMGRWSSGGVLLVVFPQKCLSVFCCGWRRAF
jgi:hypothetical protein